ncbi:hypothetical protein [Arachidicoccus sp.]|uniref:hypothetical protein n=1 Tax=Arachidicoccus sp. TaxID=1872624 RepID=UPI003D20E1E8
MNQYDSNFIASGTLSEVIIITYESIIPRPKIAIAELKRQLTKKKEASSLFGNEKDDSFSGILPSVVQTFDGIFVPKY